MHHHSETAINEPSTLFHSSPRLLQDFNRWEANSSPEHTHYANESWAPSFNHGTEYNTTTPLPNNAYTSPTNRDYSPLLNSPISPDTQSSTSPELYATHSNSMQQNNKNYNHHNNNNDHYQYLQPSLMAKDNIRSGHSRDNNSNREQQPQLHSPPSDNFNHRPFEPNQRWVRNHHDNQTPSPTRTESKQKTPYPLSDRRYGATKPFILKLGFLLANPQLYGDVARWDATGTSFIITVNSRLLKEVLPELFSHGSSTALTRQLTTYSFTHLKPIDLAETEGESSKGISIWRHQFFTRDDTSTLNRLLPRPSRARREERREKVERSTLGAYSERFLAGKI